MLLAGLADSESWSVSSMTPSRVKELIARKGQEATFKHMANTPDPTKPYNPVAASTTEAMTLVILPISLSKDITHLFPTTTIKEAAKALIAAIGLASDPKRGDLITDASGGVWTVHSSRRLAPDGIALMWEAVLYK